MGEIKPNLIIIGSMHDAGLLAMKIAELKSANPNCEVVTIEEASQRGLTQNYEIKAPPPLPDLQMTYLKDNFYSNGKSARNKRREEQRMFNKRK